MGRTAIVGCRAKVSKGWEEVAPIESEKEEIKKGSREEEKDEEGEWKGRLLDPREEGR